MTWAKTFFGDMTDAQVKAEIRKMYDEHGRRLPEVDEETMERLIRIDCEINVLTYQLWRENCEGLRRIGINADAYEAAGPVTYGSVPGEYRRAAAVSRPLMHDAEPPPGHRRLCGTILAIR